MTTERQTFCTTFRDLVAALLLAFLCSCAYTVGGTVTGLSSHGLVLQDNREDDLAIDSNGNFEFLKALPSRSSYEVTIKTQPAAPDAHRVGQKCGILRNAQGIVAQANVTNVAVDCHVARFAFIANAAAGSIPTYTVDAWTGQMRATGYLSTGAGVGNVSAGPGGKFVYAANRNQNSVLQFRVETDGRLSPLDPTAVPAGSNPTQVAIHPNGRFAYAVHGGGIAEFSITPGSGALHQVSDFALPKPPLTNVEVLSMLFSPNGQDAYVAAAQGVLHFAVEPSLGELRFRTYTPIEHGERVSVMSLHPSGHFLYLATDSGKLWRYKIASFGDLEAVHGPAVSSGGLPSSMAVHPSGRFMYVASAGDHKIFQYFVDTDGSISALSNASIAAGQHPTAIVIEPQGRYVYVADIEANAVMCFGIGPDGSLEANALASGRRTLSGPTSIALIVSEKPVSYVPKYAYVVTSNDDRPNEIWQYRFDDFGSLTPMEVPRVLVGYGPTCHGLTVDRRGRYLYAENIDQELTPPFAKYANISQYKIGDNGWLYSLNPRDLNVVSGWCKLKIEPRGRFLYGDNGYRYRIGFDGRLVAEGSPLPSAGDLVFDLGGKFVFQITSSGSGSSYTQKLREYLIQDDGSLALAGSYLDNLSFYVEVDPSGRYLYGSNGSWINQYQIGANGEIAPLDVSSIPDEGRYPAMHPSGRFAYFLDGSSGSVSQFKIDPSGVLIALSPPKVTSQSIAGVPWFAIEESGRYAYVTDGSVGKIFQFSVGGDGTLSPLAVPWVMTGRGAGQIVIVSAIE